MSSLNLLGNALGVFPPWSKEIIPPCVAFYNSISNDVKKVRVKVLDKFERELDTDYNTIKYNGIFWSDYL
jgi:hypothetical protein